MLIADVSRRNAAFFPTRDAVVVPGGQTLSWAEFDERTDRWANALAGLGLTSSDRVSMLSGNCAEFMEFFFACAKSGLAGVPLNLRHSQNEQVGYVNYVTPSALIVHASESAAVQEWLPLIPSVKHVIGFGGEHPFALDLEELLAAADAGMPDVVLDPDAPYMLCPTSGTTGKMKAAVMTQANAMSAMFAWSTEFPILEHDTYLQCIPMYLNAGGPSHVSQVFLKGGRTVILPGFDPARVLHAIAEYRVTHSVAVPTMIRALLAQPDIETTDTSSLRAIVLGGAPVDRALVLAARKSIGDCLYPTLGLAETFSCGLTLSPQNQKPEGTPDELRQLGSMGRPHVHLYARVVDAEGNDVPRDGETPGEIWFRGGSVSSGYFAMPEETAQSRVGDWFRTGDVVVTDPDGFITIVDRMKDVIISGGYNVASVEVEAVINSHPGVLECAVIGRPDERWGESVHAVVVRSPGSTVTDEEILAHLKGQLARYKQPHSFEYVETLPRNSTGKVLKRDLRARFTQLETTT